LKKTKTKTIRAQRQQSIKRIRKREAKGPSLQLQEPSTEMALSAYPKKRKMKIAAEVKRSRSCKISLRSWKS
jgi:hypothetical protein